MKKWDLEPIFSFQNLAQISEIQHFTGIQMYKN